MRQRHRFAEPLHFFIGVCKIARISQQVREWDELALPDELAKSLRAESESINALSGKFQLDYTALLRDARRRCGHSSLTREANTKISLSSASRAIFSLAAELAAAAPAVTTLHLFGALLEDAGSPIVAILNENLVNVAALKSTLLAPPTNTFPASASPVNSSPIVERQLPPPSGLSARSLLDRFGKDLTRLAREGLLKECIGRHEELLQVVRALDRDTKNNPLLVGEPGVGKTAIVEGLAWRITHNKSLPGKRIVQIQTASLIAGTKYRGEFEERLQSILREAANQPDLILFIDEIHSLIGAGDRSGALDAANIMKPALARGELRCIGATTHSEYRKFIERDPAFERRFQPVLIHELSPEKTLELLRKFYAPRFAERHDLTIGAGALEATVRLCVRYLPDRRLPDKAIDLLDDACARITTPVLSAQPGEAQASAVRLVTLETVARALSEKTGVPLGQMMKDEDQEKRERILAMAAELKSRVIGQDQACDKVAQTVQRALSGLKAVERPIGVLLFFGPTGVGKTELAKATAEFLFSLFGTGGRLVRLDMSEYRDAQALSRLTGAPPGYTGREEEGQLTGALRRAPYSVMLLDEIEKAHPDVRNLFLQLFDEGRLTDSHGRTANATHTLFIMTSNVGARVIKGFTPQDALVQTEALLKELRREFSPEFLNRLDDVIVFRALAPEHLKRIARLMLSDLDMRLAALNMGLEVSEAALALLSEKGYNETYGARPLRRVIEQHLENNIAGMILREEAKAGHTISVDASAGELTFELKERKAL